MISRSSEATDSEDGPLPDASLTWSSSRDGLLGTGASRVESLSSGFHRIELTGRDSDSQSGSRSVTVVVGIVGDCDDDGIVLEADIMRALGCLNGPDGAGLDPDCACADVEGDNDVDLFDFSFLQQTFASDVLRRAQNRTQ